MERDIPQLGIRLRAPELRRFWTLLANSNAQLLNFAELGRNFGLSEVSVRRYVEVLQSALIIRSLQPWHENISKRQVKRPKIYLRDTGLMHTLLNIQDIRLHPQMGASWESFVIENIITILGQSHPLLGEEKFYFWRSHQNEELDLFFEFNGKRFGFEVKFNMRPQITKSMEAASAALGLSKLFVMTPEGELRQLGENTYVVSLAKFKEQTLELFK